jgi:hypothetical protein
MPETKAALDVRTATPTKQLIIERTLKASPERIFDAFTDPEQLTPVVVAHGFHVPGDRSRSSRRRDVQAGDAIARYRSRQRSIRPLHEWRVVRDRPFASPPDDWSCCQRRAG